MEQYDVVDRDESWIWWRVGAKRHRTCPTDNLIIYMKFPGTQFHAFTAPKPLLSMKALCKNVKQHNIDIYISLSTSSMSQTVTKKLN